MSEALRAAVFWMALALVAVHVGLALAAAGIPCLTALVGLRTTKQLKIFIDKFGQQAATFALLGGLWAFLVLLGGGTVVFFLSPAEARAAFGFPRPLAAVIVPLLLGAAVFLAYRGLWQSLKARKSLHTLLGIAATVLFWLALYASLATLRPLATGLPVSGWGEQLLPTGPTVFWRILALSLVLSLHLAGTFTGAWLVWRRGKDDFGRDYYNFTMRLSAGAGFAFGLTALALVIWVCLGLMPAVGELTPRLTAALAAYGTGMLLALGGEGFVATRENALPQKFVLVLAFLGSVLALTGLLAGLANVSGPAF